jgi:hypothetical protein
VLLIVEFKLLAKAIRKGPQLDYQDAQLVANNNPAASGTAPAAR